MGPNGKPLRSLEQGQEQLERLKEGDWQEVGDRGLGSMDRECNPLGFELDPTEFGQADWIEETPGDASSGVTGFICDPDQAAPTAGLVPFHSWVETVAAASAAQISERAPEAASTPVSATTTTSGAPTPVSSGPTLTGARLFPQAFAEEEEDPWQNSADPWSCAGSVTSAAATSIISTSSLADDYARQIARERASRPDLTELFSKSLTGSPGGCPPPADEAGAAETPLREFSIATPSPTGGSRRWKAQGSLYPTVTVDHTHVHGIHTTRTPHTQY